MEDRLQKFARLVELGSFTKASSALHLSQPALSTAIKKLERELKEPLLEHGQRPIKLTPAGKYAYATAKELGIVTDNLSFKISRLKQQKVHLSIGMVDSVAHTVLDHGEVFDNLENQANLSLVINNTRYLIDAALRNDIDMAFVVEPRLRSSRISPLQLTYIGSEPMIIVCHRDQFQSAMRAIDEHKLSPFISYDRSSNTSRLIEEAFNANNIKLRPTLFSTSPEIILQLVAMNKGSAVLPYLTARNLLEKGDIVPIHIGGTCIIYRRICLMEHRGKELPLLARETAVQIHDMFEQLITDTALIDKQTS